MRKFLIYFVLVILLVVLAAIISLRFFPKLYVSAFNQLSTEQVTTEQLDVNFIPLEIRIGNLGVTNSDKASIVTFEKATLSAQLLGWLKGKQNFWKAGSINEPS